MRDGIIYVTMRDGNNYHGPIRAKANDYVPCFERNDNLYYLRTQQLHHYASFLYHLAPVRPYNFDLHTPRHAIMKIGTRQIYSADNFEVYHVNEHRNASTGGGVEGNLPEANYIYIRVAGKGVYRAVLQ